MKLYEGEYAVRMVDLPGDIHGATRLTRDSSNYPNIYINDWLAPAARRKAFDHEMNHLERDDFYNDKPIAEIEE